MSAKTAAYIAWATVNKQTRGPVKAPFKNSYAKYSARHTNGRELEQWPRHSRFEANPLEIL